MTKTIVGVFRTKLGMPSEAFIFAQTRHLSRYSPLFLTRQAVDSIMDGPVIDLSRCDYPKLRRIAFTLFRSALVFPLGEVERASLIHAHFGPDAAMILPTARKHRLPLVVTMHGFDATSRMRSLLGTFKPTNIHFILWREQLMRYSSRIIGVSNFLARTLITAGYPKDKVVPMYVGVDCGLFQPLAQRVGKGGLYILNVARHVEVKGIGSLLKAFGMVAKKHPMVRLIQVGAGPLSAELRRVTRDLGLDGRVEFLGLLPNVKVLELMRSATVVALTSETASNGAQEAFGLVLAEASACGIPVVGTRHGGIPEAVVEGVTGLLVKERCPDDLVRALDALLSDSKLRRNMGIAGAEFVREKFSLIDQTRKLETLYDETIESCNGKE